jgi:hypothetical protein
MKINSQVYQIVVKPGGKDWYFPYMNATPGGVGECTVPIGQPDGTLALTGSMNGCALQVNRTENDFVFYHDSNGTSLAALQAGGPAGSVVAKHSGQLQVVGIPLFEGARHHFIQSRPAHQNV